MPELQPPREKLYYSIGEVADMFHVNASLIRYWEKEFTVLKPKKNRKGDRLFTTRDISILREIYQLVKERGMTLEGAKKQLKSAEPVAESHLDSAIDMLQKARKLLVQVRDSL